MDAKTSTNTAAIQFNHTAWVVASNPKIITDEQSLENSTGISVAHPTSAVRTRLCP